MPETGELRVSTRGQMSLPATARHRWHLDDGGEVGYLDLGDAVVIVPGGIERLRKDVHFPAIGEAKVTSKRQATDPNALRDALGMSLG